MSAAAAQLQTYVRELPVAFRFAVVTVASDGLIAKYGTPFTPLNTSLRGTSTTTASP